MATKTYRDPATGKIYTEGGEHIKDLKDYRARVFSGELSGTPEDISRMPSTRRSADGGIERLVSSPVSEWKNQSGFLQSVKDVIKRKQSIQQPLTEQKAYWRTLQRSTQPFGGKVDPVTESMPGRFTDTRLRELSPADQASVRASRQAAVSAHLQGIKDEEEYRGTRVEDIAKNIADIMEEQNVSAKEAADEAYRQELLKIQRAELSLKQAEASRKAEGSNRELWSDANVRDLAAKTGIAPTELANKSDDELSSIEQEYFNNSARQAANAVPKAVLSDLGLSRDDAEIILWANDVVKSEMDRVTNADERKNILNDMRSLLNESNISQKSAQSLIESIGRISQNYQY